MDAEGSTLVTTLRNLLEEGLRVSRSLRLSSGFDLLISELGSRAVVEVRAVGCQLKLRQASVPKRHPLAKTVIPKPHPLGPKASNPKE